MYHTTNILHLFNNTCQICFRQYKIFWSSKMFHYPISLGAMRQWNVPLTPQIKRCRAVRMSQCPTAFGFVKQRNVPQLYEYKGSGQWVSHCPFVLHKFANVDFKFDSFIEIGSLYLTVIKTWLVGLWSKLDPTTTKTSNFNCMILLRYNNKFPCNIFRLNDPWLYNPPIKGILYHSGERGVKMYMYPRVLI